MSLQTLSIPLPASGDWSTPLTFLAERCIEGVEEAGPPYRRSAQAPSGDVGWVSLAVDAATSTVKVEFNGLPREFVEARSRRLLGLFDQPVGALEHLRRDPLLAPTLETGLPRLPGSWDGFEVACRAVLGQQVTVKAARTFARRISERHGTSVPDEVRAGSIVRCFPTPDQIATGNLDGLGITGRRIKTLQQLGAETSAGTLDLGEGAPASIDSFIERMVALPGIGPWTAHYIALRAFAAEDAFPPGDAGLLRAFRLLGGEGGAKTLDKYATAWAPYRGYAALALWQYDAAMGGLK